jgi:iron complex outermembrane receptor protein
VELEAKLPKGIKARASYTLQQSVDMATHRRLSNSPEHLAKLNLMVPLYGEKLLTGVELQYSSETEDALHRSTPGYVLANWTLFSHELVRGLDVSATIYNVFDRKYGYPGGPEHLQKTIEQDGRTFRVKLTYRF